MSPSRLGVLRQACLECKACALGQRPLAGVTPVFGRPAAPVIDDRPVSDEVGGERTELTADGQPVAALDPASIRLVIVGEAPGPQENKAGRPFVGPAGGILDSLLTWARIDTGAVWITNAVACWPHEAGKGPAPRTVPPDHASIATCRARHLGPQFDAFPEARVILALGMSAAIATLREWPDARKLQPLLAFRPGETAGNVRVHEDPAGRKVLVTYHPSYLARRGFKDGDRPDTHEDAAVVLKAFIAARELAGAGR